MWWIPEQNTKSLATSSARSKLGWKQEQVFEFENLLASVDRLRFAMGCI